MSALDFPCAVSHDTDRYLAGEASDRCAVDAADGLARDLAMDALELADLCKASTGLRVAICEIAMSAIADRYGAIVEAIKEHAADELDRRLEIEAEAQA